MDTGCLLYCKRISVFSDIVNFCRSSFCCLPHVITLLDAVATKVVLGLKKTFHKSINFPFYYVAAKEPPSMAFSLQDFSLNFPCFCIAALFSTLIKQFAVETNFAKEILPLIFIE